MFKLGPTPMTAHYLMQIFGDLKNLKAKHPWL